MLEIVNITQNTSTNIQFKQFSGEAPTQLTLRPGDKYVLANALMKLYSTGVKQNVAAMVAKAIIAVNNSADVHVYPDKDHIPDYDKGCVQGPGPVLALACTPVILPIGGTTPPTLQKDMPDCNPYCISISNKSSTSDGLHWDDEVTGLEMAIAAFNILRDTYDAHAVSLAYHPVAGVKMVGIPPTNLPTLLARLITLRTTFNTHLGAAAHVAADPVNAITAGIPVTTLKQAVEMIRIITSHFNSHRLQNILVGTVALTPIQILNNTY